MNGQSTVSRYTIDLRIVEVTDDGDIIGNEIDGATLRYTIGDINELREILVGLVDYGSDTLIHKPDAAYLRE